MKVLIYHNIKERLKELLELTIIAFKDTKVSIDYYDHIDYERINKKRYDLSIIYMDKDYLTLVHHLEYHGCMNILVSNNLNDVPIAFYLHAYAFIYKKYHFIEIIHKAIKQYKENHICLFVETERKKVQVLLKDIIYIEICNDECKVITSLHIYHGIIKDIQSLIPKLYLYQFIQIHRNFIVGIDYIQGYRQKEIIMKNKHVLPLSLKYKHQFYKTI